MLNVSVFRKHFYRSEADCVIACSCALTAKRSPEGFAAYLDLFKHQNKHLSTERSACCFFCRTDVAVNNFFMKNKLEKIYISNGLLSSSVDIQHRNSIV